MSTRRRLALTATILVALLGGAPGSPAAADPEPGLALRGFADIEVDAAHGHVFVSQNNGEVVVTDLAGTPVTTIRRVWGAKGMAFSGDGSRLYVAMTTGDAIGVINTTTLALSRLETGPATCPVDVAAKAGLVWFTSACDAQFGRVGTVNPRTGAVRFTSTTLYDARLYSHPKVPRQLLVTQGSQVGLEFFRVSGGPAPTMTSSLSRYAGGGKVAFMPDGQQFLSGSSVFLTDDLSSDGSFDSTTRYAHAPSVRSDGMVALGPVEYADPDIVVFDPDTRAPVASFEIGEGFLALGSAFGPTHLYVVTQGTTGKWLSVVTPPAPR